MKRAFAACACLLLLGCGTPARAPSGLKVSHLPPTSKDVIDAVMASSQMPLADASCSGFGTEPADKTVGRYLSGYLVELSSQEDRNAITTSVERSAEGGEAVFLCEMTIRHAKGEDVWSWGVRFAIRQSDGMFVPNSIRCIGAG